MTGGSNVKLIKLTQDRWVMVDDEDYDWLNQWKWSAQRGYNTFYAGAWTPMKKWVRRRLQMHRLIVDAPEGLMVDHKDGNGLNNQRSNLRICTHSQNARNQAGNRNRMYSRYKGVTWHKGAHKWQAAIRGDNKMDYYLGCFIDEQDAAIAYNTAATRLHGEFARLNNV